MGINDILSDIRGPLDTTSPCLIVERPEGGLSFRNDALMDDSLGAFYIIKNVNRKNPTDLEDVHDEMKILCLDIVKRMQYERTERNRSNKAFPFQMLFFQLDRVKYFPVGPILGSCYGWRIEVDLTDTIPLTFDKSKWSDLDPARNP